MSDRHRPDKPEALEAALIANRRRREAAEVELAEARQELSELLDRGVAAGLSVSRMARLAGVSRETAHKWLRDVHPNSGRTG